MKQIVSMLRSSTYRENSAREFQTNSHGTQPQKFPDAHIWITLKRLCLLPS